MSPSVRTMFRIAFSNDNCTECKPLEMFDTYEDADDAYDKWTERMPNAWVDIQEKINGEWLVVS